MHFALGQRFSRRLALYSRHRASLTCAGLVNVANQYRPKTLRSQDAVERLNLPIVGQLLLPREVDPHPVVIRLTGPRSDC